MPRRRSDGESESNSIDEEPLWVSPWSNKKRRQAPGHQVLLLRVVVLSWLGWEVTVTDDRGGCFVCFGLLCVLFHQKVITAYDLI